MMQHGGEEYLSPEEASSMLGVSRRTLERYVRDGKIARYRKGLRVLFKRVDVQRLYDRMNDVQLDDQTDDDD